MKNQGDHQVVRTVTAFDKSTKGTLAASWAGIPEVGNIELSLKGSRRVGQQDRRGHEFRA